MRSHEEVNRKVEPLAALDGTRRRGLGEKDMEVGGETVLGRHAAAVCAKCACCLASPQWPSAAAWLLVGPVAALRGRPLIHEVC